MGSTCPVPGCNNKLGTTKYGEPFLMCKRHWSRVPKNWQNQLWRVYRAWQRIERQPKPWSGPLVQARAVAVQEYIDVRNECVRKAAGADVQQLEMAR